MKKYFVKNSKGQLVQVNKANKFRSLGYDVLVQERIKTRVLKAYKS